MLLVTLKAEKFLKYSLNIRLPKTLPKPPCGHNTDTLGLLLLSNFHLYCLPNLCLKSPVFFFHCLFF